jgi:UDP-GlcNAc3NAcA epimerase
MKKTRLASIIGTRPQIIKHSILSRALVPYFEVSTIYTGQHWDPALFQSLIIDLELTPPTITNSLPLIIESREERLQMLVDNLKSSIVQLDPDLVIVFGDTDSTLAGALAASTTGVPFVHIEAGERSFNQDMPEERNRVLTDQMAQIKFCVSSQSLENLQKEGIAGNSFLTGDVMKDLLLLTAPKINEAPYSFDYYYASLHRNYTQADKSKLASLLDYMNGLGFPVIFSLHPSTRRWMEKWNIDLTVLSNIRFIEPVTYTRSIQLQKFSKAILTDSGGIQKEAYWLKKTCITLRKETEWLSTLAEGWNKLCYEGTLLSELIQKSPGKHDPHLYGDGYSSERICKILRDDL